jgi:hypothetical protein
MKIDPKCLKFHESANKGAAYTSDGFMLPCCWMDDPPVHRYAVEAGLKDPELAVANNESLVDIFTSDQWENFFTTLLHNPCNASYMCKKKCGIGFDAEELKAQEREENRKIRNNNG